MLAVIDTFDIFLRDDPDQDQWSKITRIMVPLGTEEPIWARIRRFLWCTMIRVILDDWFWSGSSQRKALVVSFQVTASLGGDVKP